VEHSLSEFKFRRANLDDLDRLIELWERHDFDPIDLEPRLIEFHIAENEEGVIHAAIGIRNQDRQAMLHHECWSAEMKPQLRRDLAHHAFSVCEMMQLWKIWTLLDDTHWQEMGFDDVPAEKMDDLPKGFGDWKKPWKAYKLKADIASDANLARQFELLKIENDATNTRIEKTGKFMRLFGYFVVSIIVIAVVLGVIAFFKTQNGN